MFSLSSFPSFNSWQQSSFLKRAYSSGGQFNIANKFGTVNFPQIKGFPLSKHVTIYRFLPTAYSSIGHRVTGVALSGFAALAFIPYLLGCYQPKSVAQKIREEPAGRLLMRVPVLPLVYHGLNGLKHVIQGELGRCLMYNQATAAALAVAALTVPISFIGAGKDIKQVFRKPKSE
eukprot:TRINITY_DN18223_c0_g1_i1.p1 TRINITY_DN18223_c0_g1~~TRINITY_DN18223_c0_g1_i1.p1  ORF type:complete len:175 (-),score=17.03 TRINITY_DN18223_c0_g1_i1:10-534(-)